MSKLFRKFKSFKMSSRDQSSADAVRQPSFASLTGERTTATTRTLFDDDHYAMDHARRGDCHIFVYDTYLDPYTSPRPCADHDTEGCTRAFEKLGFKVTIHKNGDQKYVLQTINKVSELDHSDCDALVVVFMSHGDTDKKGNEVLHVFDGTIAARQLWASFEGDRCPTLAGKPKMFFIQACRGAAVDPGVALQVKTDSVAIPPKRSQQYVVPSQADFLIMWASERGKAAFKTERNGISGSVFIHFLCQNIERYGCSHSFDYVVLKTSRCVALQFESSCANRDLDEKKQVPQTVSTLLRSVQFTSPKP